MDRIKRQILQALLVGEVSVYELIDRQDASLNEFFEVFKELLRENIIEVDRGKVKLTKSGREIAKNLRNFGNYCCINCEGTGYVINKHFSEILRRYREIVKNRPEAVDVYDQGFISPEGIIRRVEFIHERGDLYGKIFVVGDDDLFSIAAALTDLPEKIFVVDIDERLVNFINNAAKEYGLRIEAMVYDVQQAFPEELRRKFDIFVTDPVETIPGLKLFFSRAVSTLKGVGSAGYFGITTLEASRRKWYEIEKMIYDMGFVITDMIRKFSVYPDDERNFFTFQEKLPIVKNLGVKSDYPWYKSTFFRIEAVKDPKPLVEGEMKIDEEVYKDEESWATPY
ncbi:MAG: bis-aminopropyl spermidine synthase family protein [Archaeoglobales archaeon]|nr:bis-aminopropyl spermidine synthase family protein [Archaeoglobales archaeon]